MVTQIFPTKTPEAAYPDLLRMGHVFVTSMGQRAFVDGLYGALDLAFGGDGWYYVLNKTDPRGRLFERVRFAKFDFEGVFDPNVYLSVDGEYEKWDEENFPGPGLLRFRQERHDLLHRRARQQGRDAGHRRRGDQLLGRSG